MQVSPKRPVGEGIERIGIGIDAVGLAPCHPNGGQRVVVDGSARPRQGGVEAGGGVQGLDIGVVAALSLEADGIEMPPVEAARNRVNVGVKQALTVVESGVLDKKAMKLSRYKWLKYSDFRHHL